MRRAHAEEDTDMTTIKVSAKTYYVALTEDAHVWAQGARDRARNAQRTRTESRTVEYLEFVSVL